MEDLCRICLQDGANIPINGEIYPKINSCLKVEVADVEGYPKNICQVCNTMLDSILDFIQTYKQTTRWLEGKNAEIKLYNEGELYLMDHGAESESDLTLANIKLEIELDKEEIVEIKPKQIDVIEKTEHYRKKRKKCYAETPFVMRENKKSCNNRFVKTTSIASSLLEGVYCWTGTQWSCKSKPPLEVAQQKKTRCERVESLKRRAHKSAKRVKSEPQRLCDLCGTVFANQNRLTVHKKKVHNFLPLQCDAPGCKKVCNGERNLRFHKIRKHSAKRDFVCQLCGNTFSMEKDLKCHMAKHANTHKKKEFSCSLCDKTYKTKKSVEIHERSVHTGVRPASCEVCDASFFHADYLKEHMRLHTGETPFRCPVCARGYAQRCNMKSHLRSHRFAELSDELRANMKPNYIKLLKV